MAKGAIQSNGISEDIAQQVGGRIVINIRRVLIFIICITPAED
jgi:hypothetical protein